MVDITKVTSIPDDIPEDAKETLRQKLNIWTVGAVYVYDTETVSYTHLDVYKRQIYNIIVGTWAGIIDEAVSEISIGISIARYGWKNLGSEQE